LRQRANSGSLFSGPTIPGLDRSLLDSGRDGKFENQTAHLGEISHLFAQEVRHSHPSFSMPV
jgi:hypothetical protein